MHVIQRQLSQRGHRVALTLPWISSFWGGGSCLGGGGDAGSHTGVSCGCGVEGPPEGLMEGVMQPLDLHIHRNDLCPTNRPCLRYLVMEVLVGFYEEGRRRLLLAEDS